MLYEEHFSKNPEFPYDQYELFDMDAMADTECKAEFQFRKTDIPLLAEALNIPETFVCHQGTTSAPEIEGLCVQGHRITQWNNTILDPLSLERYAVAISDKGATLDNCTGFIDEL